MPDSAPTPAPDLLLDLRGTPEEIRTAAQSSAALLAESLSGTLQLDFTGGTDGPLLELTGTRGSITLEIRGGRLDGWVRHQQTPREDVRRLDAEDALGLDDSRPHSVALTVNSAGTHVFTDGYEAFSTTQSAWLGDIGLTGISVDPHRLMTPLRFAAWGGPLGLDAVVAQAVRPEPLIEFAAAELSPRDARRAGALARGTLRAVLRTRGLGQGGTALAARGERGVLSLAVEDGGLRWRVTRDGETVADHLAPGGWDDGEWHEIAVTSGRGALQIHADGHQVLHAPGEAFFGDIGPVGRVVAGQDLDGARLWGEVRTAFLHPEPLSDHQLKRLAGVRPLPTQALFDTGQDGARSHRIPALLALDSGVLLAAADRRVSIPNDAPNEISLVLRRSLDAGRTWEPARVLLERPGTPRPAPRPSEAPASSPGTPRPAAEAPATPHPAAATPGRGRLGAAITDSALVQDRESGRLLALVDAFPGGIGQPNAEPGTGHNERGRLLLHTPAALTSSQAAFTDSQTAPADSQTAPAGKPCDPCALEPDGRVLREDGSETGHRVSPDGTVTLNGRPAGSIHLAAADAPPEGLLTARTSFLQLLTSDDDGATWSRPRDITAQVKAPWMRFLGISPGNGIQVRRGPHAGRILVPAYFNGEPAAGAPAGVTPSTFFAAALLTDDAGASWRLGSPANPLSPESTTTTAAHAAPPAADPAARPAIPSTGRPASVSTAASEQGGAAGHTSLYESALVEGEGGSVHVFARNQHPSGRVAHAISRDGGETWGPLEFLEDVPEIFSQPNAIRVSLTGGGEPAEAVVVANASQLLPFRGRGVLRITEDEGRIWRSRVLVPRHYVYQCMAQLPDGSLGILWEREWQGLFFTVLPLEWLLESRSTGL
ncbi:exo-alpha-sialidase [Arthrobacter sp. UM1]|uniref:exo-alpha-sialidase n=1 Tax=Arthrobacter sp. UM1 TaxID=2766776 RepID=UPI001CF671A0|nr:sialidase family protein [Arthrobacter sp. UM1]MCB4208920.1 exo-alpha-sialidase [Arthrobacter sp. UM1]